MNAPQVFLWKRPPHCKSMVVVSHLLDPGWRPRWLLGRHWKTDERAGVGVR